MLTFHNISPAVFEAVKSELAKTATVTPWTKVPNSAEGYAMEGSGIKATVLYDPQYGQVSVTLHARPWYITENTIAGKIREAIEAAQGTAT